MHRLFVAIEPPPHVRDALLACMGGVAGARWQRDDQLHLTLRFIGEVDRHQAQDIAAALAGVRFAQFTLRLDAPGVFDRKGRIGTLWIGVTPHDAVRALHQRIDAALTRAGVTPDTRNFLPHFTIARFTRGGGALAAAMSRRSHSAIRSAKSPASRSTKAVSDTTEPIIASSNAIRDEPPAFFVCARSSPC